MDHRPRPLFRGLIGALFAMAIVWCGCSCTQDDVPEPPKPSVTKPEPPAQPVIAPVLDVEKKTAVEAPAKEASPAPAAVEDAGKAAEKAIEAATEAATEGTEKVEEAVEGTAEPQEKETSVAPYVPTPPEVVEEMLETAGVTEKDTVYDLGCGDGRIVVMAAQKFGAKGVGIDLDPDRIAESTENVRKGKLEERVTIIQGDLMKIDLSPATVVTLYLMPDANRKLKPIMEKALKAGSRVVTHDFSVSGWEADETKEIRDVNGWEHTIYLYKMPKP
ncbi:MAG: class I SAM-dependent methyltransferase [Planctomycetes bacterium]|nr:class I SAM-dependent methyltransferase [Planctomycetota bacterium]